LLLSFVTVNDKNPFCVGQNFEMGRNGTFPSGLTPQSQEKSRVSLYTAFPDNNCMVKNET
jgi:hypothetical protein